MDPIACTDVLAEFAHCSYKLRLFLLCLLIHSSPLRCQNSPLWPKECLFAKENPTQTHFSLVQCYNCCLLPPLQKKKKTNKTKNNTTPSLTHRAGNLCCRSLQHEQSQLLSTSFARSWFLRAASRSTCLPSSLQPQCKVGAWQATIFNDGQQLWLENEHTD